MRSSGCSARTHKHTRAPSWTSNQTPRARRGLVLQSRPFNGALAGVPEEEPSHAVRGRPIQGPLRVSREKFGVDFSAVELSGSLVEPWQPYDRGPVDIEGILGSTLRRPLEIGGWRYSMIVWRAPSKWREHSESARRSADIWDSICIDIPLKIRMTYVAEDSLED